MSTATSPVALVHDAGRSGTEERLIAALEQDFLDQIGYQPAGSTITFPADHPTLGWAACPVSGCGKPSTTACGLCPTCYSRWCEQGQPDLGAYKASTFRSRGTQDPSAGSCPIPGCRRPPLTRTARLCQAHEGLRQQRGLTLEQFCRQPDVVPYDSLGECLVVPCLRERSGTGPYCAAHRTRLAMHRRKHPGLDEQHWRATTRPIAEGNVLVIAGLPERVVLELLYGLQDRHARGLRTGVRNARTLIDRARAAQIATFADLDPSEINQQVVGLRNHILAALARLEQDPRHAWSAMRWTLDPLGHHGTVYFDAITQPWLQEAARRWVVEDCPTRRGKGVACNIQAHLSALASLSASLVRHRADRGHSVRHLGRSDIIEYLNWLAYLQSTGEITAHSRHKRCQLVRKMLNRMRSQGLTRAGQCMHRCPEDFTLTVADMPDAAEPDEAGRDLPQSVMATLAADLDRLERIGAPIVRLAIELMMDTGRRPSEVCELRADCLTGDEDNRPVMVWNNSKLARYGRRLPITEATAALISAQRERVCARYPRTPVGELALLPTRRANPDGRRGIGADHVSSRHRRWIAGLELTAPVAVMIDGHTTTQRLAFDPDRITLYSYRHSYAQRHADAGVAVDVLCELMDHRSMSTTQGYYRVSEHRRRDAVDRVTTMQFDRHGQRLWRRTEGLLDSERARRGLGEVAVPYGLCTEPSNVVAGGGDCPVRYRCVGCDHFRTDVSYLPDLEAYLADLRRNRERLLAVAADDWAKNEATPSEEEIRRVRGLIERIKTDLDDLDETEHGQIEQAVTAVRRARSGVVGLGMPRIRPALPGPREEHAS